MAQRELHSSDGDQQALKGYLRLRIHKARKLNKDQDWHTVYLKLAVVSAGKVEKYKSGAYTGEGQQAVWEQAFNFTIWERSQKLQLEIWRKGEGTDDAFVGLQIVPVDHFNRFAQNKALTEINTQKRTHTEEMFVWMH